MLYAKTTRAFRPRSRDRLLPAAALAAVALVAASPASSQDQQTDHTWVEIEAWNTDFLYDGWSAQALLHEDVYGADGDVIGEVEDFIIGPDGSIEKVVVEGGGFLDIGDAHLAVPWDQVERVGTEGISTPIEEGNLDDFGIFENVEDMPAEPPNFRLSNMLYDYVTADGVGYGTVDDVVFSEDGKIEAVIAQPAYGYGYGTGPYAVPYAADAYRPYSPYYETPYGVEELADLRPFDYREFE